jgi:RimJ/RimL family protein N-acetyltransferase
MILGPAFLRENFAAAFAAPMKTAYALLKPRHPQDAAAIAEFFNADDHAVLKHWSWSVEEDYTEGYVLSSLLDYLEEADAGSGSFTLNIYTPDQAVQLGYMQFFGNGQKAIPFSSCYLLPSFYKAELVREIHSAAIDRAEISGLMNRPVMALPSILRAEFAKAAGGAITTSRLSIRPFVPADSDKLAGFEGLIDLRAKNYEQKEVLGIETDQLFAGIFSGADGQLIGDLAFWQDQQQRPRMSYQILPAWQGRGLASEAHRACLSWTDSFLPVPIARADFVVGNHPSESVLRKSGFHNVGEFISDMPGFEGVTKIAMERPALVP